MDALTTRLDLEATPPVLSVEGDIDIATEQMLRRALDAALTEHPHLVVDMRDVAFIDAAGIRVVLGAAAKLNGSGPLRVVNAPRLAWLLDVVGLKTSDAIEICDAH